VRVDDELGPRRHAAARHGLVAEGDGAAEFASACPPFLGGRERRGNDLDPRMPVGEEVAFVMVQLGVGNAVEYGRIDPVAGAVPMTHAGPGADASICLEQSAHSSAVHMPAGITGRESISKSRVRARTGAGIASTGVSLTNRARRSR